jgi:hypothetical protein
LTLLKRPEEEGETEGIQIASAGSALSSDRTEAGEQEEEIDIGRIQEQEREHIKSLQEQRARAVREEQKRLFGEIRIR